MVTGTTRNSGQASIMATSTPPASSARYSVWPACRKPRVLQRLLLDRIGHQTGDLAGKGEPGGALDRSDGRAGALAGSGCPGRTAARRRTGSTGKADRTPGRPRPVRRSAARERQARAWRPGLPADRHRRDEEGPTAGGLPLQPRLQGEFAADAGRLAHRDGERRGARHVRCLMSIDGLAAQVAHVAAARGLELLQQELLRDRVAGRQAVAADLPHSATT